VRSPARAARKASALRRASCRPQPPLPMVPILQLFEQVF
jgi:hypothetical protein